MKVSIMENWNINYWVDYSKFWAEVIDITNDDFSKIEEKTHTLEQKYWLRWLLELPVVEPTEEEIRIKEEQEKTNLEELNIQEISKLIIRKLAFEFLWKSTTEIEQEINALKPKQSK